MKIANADHERRPWRIHELVPDFKLEDVWELPVEGDADEFPELLGLAGSFRPAEIESAPTRFLWNLRDQLGRWLDLGEISSPADPASTGERTIPGATGRSLAARLPEDLRGSGDGFDFGSLPFVPLYRTDREAAAEISNRTVHGVAHLAWVEQPDGRFRGQMAVYVKPRGAFGHAYMAAIKPFRHWIVYPALMKQMENMWSERPSRMASA